MKLEIDIPNIIYNEAKENRGYISVSKMEIVWKAIADGKPLEQEPKTGQCIKSLIVLDKIRAEIEALPKTYPFINHIDTYVKEDDVKKIIDKYMTESEK